MENETNHTAESGSTGFSVAESPKCDHCGHVRGLHGRSHGCISAFADGVPGQSCACSGFVRPTAESDGMAFRDAFTLVQRFRDAVDDVSLAIHVHPTGTGLGEDPRYAEASARRRAAEEALLRALTDRPTRPGEIT